MFGKLIKKVAKFTLGLGIGILIVPKFFAAMPEEAKAIPFLFTTQEGVELMEELAVTAVNAESEALTGTTFNENSKEVPDYTLGKAKPAKEKATSIVSKIKKHLPHFEEAVKKAGIKGDWEGANEDLTNGAAMVHEDNVNRGFYN